MPAKQETNMKIQNRLAIVAVTAIASMFIMKAKAQYLPVGDDGIAASPKVRAMLNDRVRTSSASVANNSSFQARADQSIAASPNVRQTLAGRKAGTAAPEGTAVVSAQSRTTDPIAVSLKLREQLDERNSRQLQIAPLK